MARVVASSTGPRESSSALKASPSRRLTHIGIDHAVGYGLKYPTGFKDTHLQRV